MSGPGNSYVSVSASELRYFFAFDRITEGGMLVTVVVEAGAPDTEAIEAAITNELGLYEPMRDVIEHDCAQDHPQDLLAVEITALGGSRRTGIWSRPDIVTVEVRTFENTAALRPAATRTR